MSTVPSSLDRPSISTIQSIAASKPELAGYDGHDVAEDRRRYGQYVEEGEAFYQPESGTVYRVRNVRSQSTIFELEPSPATSPAADDAVPPHDPATDPGVTKDGSYHVDNVCALGGALQLGELIHLPIGAVETTTDAALIRADDIVLELAREHLVTALRAWGDGSDLSSTELREAAEAAVCGETPFGSKEAITIHRQPLDDASPSTSDSRSTLDKEENDITTRFFSCQPFSAYTFDSSTVREWLYHHLEDGDRILNVCAGLWELTDHDGDIVRNDIRENVELQRPRTINGVEYDAGDTVPTKADLTVDAAELAAHLEKASFDVAVFDPPWSTYQSQLRYEGYHVTADDPELRTAIDLTELPFTVPSPDEKSQLGHARLVKENIDWLLKPGGRFIQITQTATGMPARLRYEQIERAMFNPVGEQKTVDGVVDQKMTDIDGTTVLENQSNVDARLRETQHRLTDY